MPQSDRQTHALNLEFPRPFKLLVWYGSYLVFPFFGVVLWYGDHLPSILTGAMLVLATFFTWARFGEPRQLRIRSHQLPLTTKTTTRLAIISDLHVGVFGKPGHLRRMVDRVNDLTPAYVLIAGDFTLDPKPGTLAKLLAPLAKLEAPTFAVLGGHDLELPGPPIRAELEAALKTHGVLLLNNEVVDLPEFELIGLGDYTAYEDRTEIIPESGHKPQVVLTHNPDTTTAYDRFVDLTICGHTHAGQVRIPWLYTKIIPTHGTFDTGLSQEPNTTLYITAGLGETGLPVRLFNPPTIDILELQPHE